MKYWSAIKNFEFTNTISQINLPFNKNHKKQLPKPQNQLNQLQQFNVQVDYQQSQCFMQMLRANRIDIEDNQNKIRRKIQIFESLNVQPVYFDIIKQLKILQFQFQLGSDVFLQRTEALYTQVAQINKAIKQILSKSIQKIFIFFQLIQKYKDIIEQYLCRVQKLRNNLLFLKTRKEFKIFQKIKKKKIIKEKLKLLDNVKKKKEIACKDIDNIDQAFFTEQNRVKLYKKIIKLTQLQKCMYINVMKNKLISIAKNNVKILQEGLQNWMKDKLSLKQIEKLVFMIYFVQKQDIYKDNQIIIDYKIVDAQRLQKELLKILQWRQFHYMQNMMNITSKIHQFVYYLISKIK